MVAGKRMIKDGRKFDQLFPAATGENELIHSNARLKHTLRLIPEVVQHYCYQTERIAQYLKAANRYQNARTSGSFASTISITTRTSLEPNKYELPPAAGKAGKAVLIVTVTQF